MRRILQQVSVILLSLVLFPGPAITQEQQDIATSTENVILSDQDVEREWVTEKNGDFIPLDTRFVDENGEEVTLGSFIDRPTLILPIYFYCPSACSRNLANMAVAMNRLSFDPGKDYRAIALSFSDTETSVNAHRAKQNYLKLVYDGFPEDEWKFLTGTEESIAAVTDALGYRFKRMPDQTFIHPSTIIAVDREGKIIRYVYGTFVPGDVDMAISAAKEGIPVLSVRRFLEFCLDYDPDKNKAVFQYVKVAVLLFFAIGVGVFFFLFGRKRRTSRHRDHDQLKRSNEQEETP